MALAAPLATFVRLTVVLPMLLACAERPTEPARLPRSAGSSALSNRAIDAGLSTLAWQATGRSLVASHPTVSPIVATRAYALLGVAQYAAVVAADADKNNGQGSSGRALYEARRGAIAAASADMLTFLFPDSATALASQLALDGSANANDAHPQFTRGTAAGHAMAARMIEWAKADGFSKSWDQVVPTGPGGWVAAAGAPSGFQFPTMTPYFLTNQNQFRPAPHPARGTPGFQTDLEETVRLANTRGAFETTEALNWNLNVGTITALGYWDQRVAQLIEAGTLDERTAAHIFALVNTATMDAVIGCWEAKYHYLLLRPWTADPVGLPNALPNPILLIGKPNHPSYPSGHSCVSAAAAEVITSYFPDEGAALSSEVVRAGNSRIYAGIHYRFDVTAGQALGRSVAQWAMAYDREHGLLAAVGIQ